MADREVVHLMYVTAKGDDSPSPPGIPADGEVWCGAERDKVSVFTFRPSKTTCSACLRALSVRPYSS